MSSEQLVEQKKALRKHMRQARRSLSDKEQKDHAVQVARCALTLAEFKEATKIALYIANDGELALDALLDTAVEQGKICYLPKITGNDMSFHLYSGSDSLVVGAYDIMEPVPHAEAIDPQQLDLVFVPLVAFDHKGDRLGMGKGFYDRCFEFTREEGNEKPILMGIAHDVQQADVLPCEPWDVRLQAIVTESGIQRHAR